MIMKIVYNVNIFCVQCGAFYIMCASIIPLSFVIILLFSFLGLILGKTISNTAYE